MATHLRCGTVWGGISAVSLDVITSGLNASLYSAGSTGGSGGDIYYFTVCDSDMLTRVAVADLRGHGEEVTALSGWLYTALQERMNTLDGAGVLSALNQIVCRQGFQAITTAAVMGYYLRDSRLYFSYAGHPPVYIWCRKERSWTPLNVKAENRPSNLPLGVLPQTTYCQDQVQLEPGDRLFLYTDGVVECPNEAGEPFGPERLLATLQNAQDDRPQQIKQGVLNALRAHAGDSLSHDDMTLMLVEVGCSPR